MSDQARKQTKIEDLPPAEEQLSPQEAEAVQGGDTARITNTTVGIGAQIRLEASTTVVGGTGGSKS
jgi:hypothetical protein